jgi:hypothetical protein
MKVNGEDHPLSNLQKTLHRVCSNVVFECVWIRRIPEDEVGSILADRHFGWVRRSSETKECFDEPAIGMELVGADMVAGEGFSSVTNGPGWFKVPGGELTFLQETNAGEQARQGWVPVLAQVTRMLSHDQKYWLDYKVYWGHNHGDTAARLGRVAARLFASEPAGGTV